jgi:hypothetical protein
MGTSTRNKGQSGHTPLVPSWLEEGGDDGREGQNEELRKKYRNFKMPINADY